MGFYFNTYADTDEIELISNDIRVTGGTQTAYNGPYNVADSDAEPLILNDSVDPYVVPNDECKVGSRILDPAAGAVHSLAATGTGWVAQYYGDIAIDTNGNMSNVGTISSGAITYGTGAQAGLDQYAVTVDTASPVELTFAGASIDDSTAYRVTLATDTTGTNSGYVGIVWYDTDLGDYQIRHVSRSGNTSNHPYLVLDSSVVKVTTDHASPYSINVTIQSFPIDSDVTPDGNVNLFGADAMWQRVINDLNYDDGSVTVTDVITGTTLEATGDTSAADAAALGYTATEGLILTGQGSTSDVTIKNDADGTVISIPTGTTLTEFASGLKLTERADHEFTPAAGFGELWVRNDATNVLVFTDDTGADTVLGAGGGSPGGSDTQVQYNNSSSFGGISGLTTDGTNLTLTGVLDAGGGVFELPNSATPTVDAVGELALDTTITSHDGLLIYYQGTESMVIPAIPLADLTTTDGHVIDYNSAGSKFTMDSPAAGGETNSLETTVTGIADTEIFIGNGVDSGTFAAISGDATLANTGVLTIAANSVALTTDTTGNYAAGDAEAGAALTGDTATAFFSAGTIEHERGGLEADVSGYSNGLFGTNGTATIDVDTEAELETALGGLDVVAVTAGDITSANLATILTNETGTGAAVFGTAPQISTIELGHASDTTLARVSAGVMSIEGVNAVTTSATQTLTNKTLTSPTIAAISSGAAITLTPTSDVLIANTKGLAVGHTAQVAFGEVTGPEFQVLGTTEADAGAGVALFSTTDALSPHLTFLKSGNATIGSNTTVADNEELGKIKFYAADGTDLDTLSAEIAVNVDDGSVAAGQIGGEIILRTATSGGALTDAVTISNAQNMTVAGSGTFGGTDQSTITEGLIVNDGGGANEDDDFIVETDTTDPAFEIDAGDEDAEFSIPLITHDINPDGDGTRDLGTQTTAQWANVWADLVNGADYAYLNSWRTLESEKYKGYPEGIAISNTHFVDGVVTEVMPDDAKPVFVVTEEFIEFQGTKITKEGFSILAKALNFLGSLNR